MHVENITVFCYHPVLADTDSLIILFLLFYTQITKASVELGKKGKPIFFPECQYLVKVSEESVCLEYILEKVNDKWNNDFVLLGNDGIKIEESDEIGKLLVSS